MNGHRPAAITTNGSKGHHAGPPGWQREQLPALVVQMDPVLAPVLAVGDELEVLAAQGMKRVPAILAEYQVHYNTARPHQGIAQHVPADEPDAHHATVTDVGTRQIRRKPVLDGLINEYLYAA